MIQEFRTKGNGFATLVRPHTLQLPTQPTLIDFVDHLNINDLIKGQLEDSWIPWQAHSVAFSKHFQSQVS